MSEQNPPEQMVDYWWDATLVENYLNGCSDQLQKLRVPMPIGVAVSLQRLDAALKNALERVQALKPTAQKQ